jgi:hypothetical protein
VRLVLLALTGTVVVLSIYRGPARDETRLDAPADSIRRA